MACFLDSPCLYCAELHYKAGFQYDPEFLRVAAERAALHTRHPRGQRFFAYIEAGSPTVYRFIPFERMAEVETWLTTDDLVKEVYGEEAPRYQRPYYAGLTTYCSHILRRVPEPNDLGAGDGPPPLLFRVEARLNAQASWLPTDDGERPGAGPAAATFAVLGSPVLLRFAPLASLAEIDGWGPAEAWLPQLLGGWPDIRAIEQYESSILRYLPELSCP